MQSGVAHFSVSETARAAALARPPRWVCYPRFTGTGVGARCRPAGEAQDYNTAEDESIAPETLSHPGKSR
jgi:hypothetical protein